MTRTWNSKAQNFLNFIEYRRGIRAREMVERIWSHFTNEEVQGYIERYWHDD